MQSKIQEANMKNSFVKEFAVAFAILFAAIFAGAADASAQQYSDWSAAVPVTDVNAPGVLEGCPYIGKDNLTLFFASNRAGTIGGADIYVTTRESEDAPWGAPVNLGPNINTTGAEVCPTYTVSGRYLYFVSNTPHPGTVHCGGDDIYVARLRDKKDLTSWEPAVNLGCQFNSPLNDITSTLFEDEDGTVHLYFSSNRLGGMGGMDIYVSEQQPDGTFGTPVPVTELNTTFNDQRPNIRYRDGLEIFFESNRHSGTADTDIYVATRPDTSSAWLTVEPLGPTVNNSLAQGRPSLSFDGTELYFMQGTPGVSSTNDIFVARREKLTGSDH
jgi:hypothetical protein